MADPIFEAKFLILDCDNFWFLIPQKWYSLIPDPSEIPWLVIPDPGAVPRSNLPDP